MAWYYYTGRVARPIPVKKGLSKSVRPNTKVEILELTAESEALIRKKELRRTGAPKCAKPVAEEPVTNVDVKKVVEKSDLAKMFAEKGFTKAPGMPPIAKAGPEMTEAELNAPKVEEADTSEDGEKTDDDVEDVDRDEELPDDSNKKGKRKKRRR